MFFFQESTPDTSGYLIAGYTIAFTIMTIYVASLFVRRRNLQRDLQALTELQSEKKAELPARRQPVTRPPRKKAASRRPAKRAARKKK